MSITYKKTVAVLDGRLAVEEAESLFDWLLNKPNAKVNLKDLTFAHTAILQLLMMFKPKVTSWPPPGPLNTLLQHHLR